MVKENRHELFDGIKDLFQMFEAKTMAEEIDYGHGRVECRRCTVIGDLTPLDKSGLWKELRSLIRVAVEQFHEVNGKTQPPTPA